MGKKMNKHYKDLESKYNIFKCNKYGIDLDIDTLVIKDNKPTKESSSELNDVHDRINSKNATANLRYLNLLVWLRI